MTRTTEDDRRGTFSKGGVSGLAIKEAGGKEQGVTQKLTLPSEKTVFLVSAYWDLDDTHSPLSHMGVSTLVPCSYTTMV